MQKAINLFYRILEIILVLLLAGMAIMVFVNVVMRYTMNSGINVSEELSRFFFVWLTFTGAVVAFREHGHMGIETFVMFLSRRARVFCMILSNIIILVCSAIFFWGTWKQSGINASMHAPVTKLSMIWVYGIGLFTGAGMCIIALERIYRYVTGRVTDDEVAQFAGENLTVEQLSER
ncbi:TRAP-type C4-dicarboxylate transport system permease small subunit [Rhizobium sp. SJZ105]|uniref:TRAP transporter small permease n=1 Tax=Rhizobium sp. SJZ105 TaxID=2572678 RepID=UPI0011AACE3D|nr:TRAP transporter small permease [Rhizobium sp. SJZ105]TWC76384.1 TRAP-type C4-dicarboxylate transport system permease small subunit [Rhizobium sp. SJZ105]